ncbi:MAG: helix-hairpin-helix domain-containing protein [Nitrospirota bacterium]
MFRSLLIKLAMLAVTATLVVWIGWPVPEPEEEAPPGVADKPVEAVEHHQAQETNVTRRAAAPGPSRADKEEIRPSLPVAKPNSRLDLNRATAEELQRLPGIGEVLAKRVVEARTSRGSFSTIEELLEVKGIGEKKLERLRPLIMVNAAGRPASGKGKL